MISRNRLLLPRRKAQAYRTERHSELRRQKRIRVTEFIRATATGDIPRNNQLRLRVLFCANLSPELIKVLQTPRMMSEHTVKTSSVRYEAPCKWGNQGISCKPIDFSEMQVRDLHQRHARDGFRHRQYSMLWTFDIR